MAYDVTQWLAEIRSLKQQLAKAQQEREEAYQSAVNWRSRYEAEATQRRADVEHLQLTIQTLRTELSTLQKSPSESGIQGSVPGAVAQEIAGAPGADLHTVSGLRSELVKALQQCDRWQQALIAEQKAHAETRQTLTTALGEAIDVFAPPVSGQGAPRLNTAADITSGEESGPKNSSAEF